MGEPQSTAQNTVASGIGGSIYTQNNHLLYAGVQSSTNSYTSNASPNNVAAVFDIWATTLPDNVTQLRIPQTAGYVLQYTRDISSGYAYITYPLTNNSNDVYSFWRYNKTYSYSDTGYISGSACGVRRFFETAYPLSNTINGDGTHTVKFGVPFGSPGFQYHSFVVMVTRDCSNLGYQCYENVFERVDISSGSMLYMMNWGVMFLLMAALFMLF